MELEQLVIWMWKDDFRNVSHNMKNGKKKKYMWIKTYMYKAELQCWVEIVSFQYVSTCTKSKAYKTM